MLVNRQKLENILVNIDQVKDQLAQKQLVFFIDYDGTLTPIVDRPEQALLSHPMRECLAQLSKCYTIAIISGRALSDVRERVAIDHIYYAGNHGLEVAGPNYYETQNKINPEFKQLIQSVFYELKKQTHDIKGVLVENKELSLSVHYRLVDECYVKQIEKIVDNMIKKYPKLNKHFGKKVFELRPKIDWNKGKVIFYLLKQLNLSLDRVTPIYLGDDATDEDAFRALKNKGVSVLVSDEIRQTAADFYLNNPKEVMQFLSQFVK